MMKDYKSIVVGIAASAAVLIATPAAAQKRDILGFKLGMTKMDVEAAGGKCGPDWDRNRSCSAEKDGQLYLRFQEHAESKLAWLIRYRFTSGSDTDEMVRNVSEQFGQPTSAGKPEWYSQYGFKETANGMLLGSPAASWDFGDGTSMGLYVHFGPLPRDYELQLTSGTLSRLDHEAKDKADEARAADREKRIRTTNPKPKF